MGCISMLAQESLPPAIDEEATARQLGLSEVEMARTLRAAMRSGVCFTRADLSFNARLAVFAEITDDLRDYLHSALASREAMSAVPEICRRDCAEIPGAHQRIKSANFADLVSDLKRLRSA
jgi:hypothetical protein